MGLFIEPLFGIFKFLIEILAATMELMGLFCAIYLEPAGRFEEKFPRTSGFLTIGTILGIEAGIWSRLVFSIFDFPLQDGSTLFTAVQYLENKVCLLKHASGCRLHEQMSIPSNLSKL